MPEFKYDKFERNERERHIFSAVDERGGIHFHVEKSPFSDPEWWGGVETHYRSPPEYMASEVGDECWLLKAPCWTDGSSLLAQEVFIPAWLSNRDDHDHIFGMLSSRMDRQFGAAG